MNSYSSIQRSAATSQNITPKKPDVRRNAVWDAYQDALEFALYLHRRIERKTR